MSTSEAYLYLGHGQDICDDQGKPIIKIVPPGNIYITVGICGLTTRWKTENLLESFIDPTNTSIWANPTKESLQEILTGILDTETLHIHYPGDTYVDNVYSPLSDFQYKDNKRLLNDTQPDTLILQISGILPLSKAPDMYKAGIPNERVYVSKTNITIPVEEFDAMFQFSRFPKIEHPQNAKTLTIEDIDTISTYYSERVSYLLKEYPGIHYNFVCRSVHPSCMPGALRRRRQSAVLFQTEPETLRKTIRNVNTKNENINEYKKLYQIPSTRTSLQLRREAIKKLESTNMSKNLSEFEEYLNALPHEEMLKILQDLQMHINVSKQVKPTWTSNSLRRVTNLLQKKRNQYGKTAKARANLERRKAFFELQEAEQEKNNKLVNYEDYIQKLDEALQECQKQKKNLTQKVRWPHSALRRNKTNKTNKSTPVSKVR
jgi:hypothetical protein